MWGNYNQSGNHTESHKVHKIVSSIVMCYNHTEYFTGVQSCYNNQPPFLNASHTFCGGMNSAYGCSNPPSWDGEDCESNVDCTRWFYRQLPKLTSDDIEMRVCCNQHHWDEDIRIQAFEFYVQ